MVLAVDIGGTKIAAGLVDASGGVSGRRTCRTPAAAGAAAVLAAAIALAGEVVDVAAPAHPRIDAVGIGSAGVVDPTSGTIVSATGNLPGWTGTAVGAAFEEAFAVPVRVLNDVHAHALGEARYGAGRGAASMLLVAVGTGIGGAYVVRGSVDVGAHFVAGHVGHVPVPEADGVPCPCGRAGHLEGLASGTGILAAYRRADTNLDRGPGVGLPAGAAVDTTYDVARLARDGQPTALAVLHRCGFATGRVVGGLLNVLDPAVVVIGGGVAEAGEPWWAALRDGVRAEAMDRTASTPLVPAQAAQGAALIGAAAAAREARNGPETGRR